MSYIQNKVSWKEKEILDFYKTVYKDGMDKDDLLELLVKDGIDKYQTIESTVIEGDLPCLV